MNTEYNPLEPVMDPELEAAMLEIRDDSVDPAVIEAAAAREGSWRSIARSSSWSAGPGSIPSSSTSVARAAW